MKGFVTENWKTASAGAAGAFLVSFLVGLVTRNPFGVVVLRAILLAVLFAVLGAGLRHLIRTYLPELVDPDAAPGPATRSAKSDGRGGRVDIVLPEEMLGGRDYGEHDQDQAGADALRSAAGAGRGEESALFDTGAVEGDAAQAETEGLGEIAELEAELSPAEEPAEARGDDAAVDVPGRGGAKRGKSDAGESPGLAGTDSGAGEDLDSLPDISNLEIAEESGPGAAREGPRSRTERPEDAVRGAVSGQDPATIAKAIRTVLRRDEKG